MGYLVCQEQENLREQGSNSSCSHGVELEANYRMEGSETETEDSKQTSGKR